jgi:hypothetical protein
MPKLPAHRSRLPSGIGDRIGLALTAVMLTGCASNEEPSRAVTRLSLVVHSSEWEADRNLVVVGESAAAEIETETDEGCLVDVPCPISSDVEVRSSDPDVVSPLQQRVRTPANVALVAHAPGTATVTVTTDGLTESRRVDVVTAPLVLDAIQVTLVTAWNDLPVQYNASHSLTWVEVPAGEYGALEIVALRSGAEVFGVSIYITVNPYLVAQATTGCRPVRIDPDCLHVGDAWIWGETPGDAQITVWGRGTCGTADPLPCTFTSTSFTAHVP